MKVCLLDGLDDRSARGVLGRSLDLGVGGLGIARVLRALHAVSALHVGLRLRSSGCGFLGTRHLVSGDACDAARISVNGKPAKASYQVKVGDFIEIAFGQRTMRVEVLEVADHVLKSDASGLYREI